MANIGIAINSKVEGQAEDTFNRFYFEYQHRMLTLYEMVGCASMGEGYNRAIRDAKEEGCNILVFTHNDVTPWASSLLWDQMIEKLKQPQIGFVGVAGATSLDADAVWWGCRDAGRGAVAHCRNGSYYMSTFGPYGPAYVMDGVLLAAKLSLFDKIGEWDESLGFHFYDIDITLRATKAGFQNYVVPFPILHGSVGEIKPEWYQSCSKFQQKHGGNYVGQLSGCGNILVSAG